MDKNIIVPNEPFPLVGNNKIKIRGRHTVSGGYLAFDWSNSGIAFNFHGTGFMLSLGEYKADQPAYVKVIIDGGARRQRFAVSNGNEKIIIEGLNDRRHRVEILKVTEGSAKLLFGELTLFGNEAALNLPPFNRPRRIEYIGDSITCGYGVLGRSVDPGYLTYQQDGTYSYAYLTSEALAADGRYICISGKGIVCNCEGNREDVKAGQYYEYQTYEGGVCDDGWQADVVVINIGTNDCGGPAGKEEFTSAGIDLISKVRARYPGSEIIWMYGMMSEFYLETIRDMIRTVSETDKKVHMLYVESMFGRENETGANGHPNVHADIRASSLLVKKIVSVTGWRRVSTLERENENE